MATPAAKKPTDSQSLKSRAGKTKPGEPATRNTGKTKNGYTAQKRAQRASTRSVETGEDHGRTV